MRNDASRHINFIAASRFQRNPCLKAPKQMSTSTNPYALGGWGSPLHQHARTSEETRPSSRFYTFRLVHPSTVHTGGAHPALIAPVDILNCIVLDPFGRRYLSTSTRDSRPSGSGRVHETDIPSIPEFADGVPVVKTIIHDDQGKIVGIVEWSDPVPVVEFKHVVDIPQKKSTDSFFIPAQSPPSDYNLFLGPARYIWSTSTESEHKLYSYDALSRPHLEAQVKQQSTGEVWLEIRERGIKRGLLDASFLATILVNCRFGVGTMELRVSRAPV
ncbi:hypothetical protein NMY22_g6026 [Coprinellus aureogranulatus]|nr:hypothetical protein NMY22_g6026 [Coprinellus aureogranulatus]